MTAAGKRYVVYRDGRQLGVFQGPALQQMARSGKLQPDDEIAVEGSSARSRAGRVRGLVFPLLQTSPNRRPTGRAGHRTLGTPPPPRPQPEVEAAPAVPAISSLEAQAAEGSPFDFGSPRPAQAGRRATRRQQASFSPLAILIAVGAVAAVVVGGVLLTGVMYVAEIGPFRDRYVALVKKGRLEGCPHRTVGELTDGFLENPRWKSIIATDGLRYVNCRGGMYYHDLPVTAELQFAIIGDSGFRLRSLEIDGEGQPLLMQAMMIRKMCEE